MVGDISKMYHSIEISPFDQMTHCFLWRNLEYDREPEMFAMQVVNFGDRPSANIAMVALRKTAEMSTTLHREASEIIISNSYMDDIVDSKPSIAEVNNIIEKINVILHRGGGGGGKIKQWNTSDVRNGPENLANVKVVERDTDKSNIEKVLGIAWNKCSDTLTFDIKLDFSIGKRSSFFASHELLQESIPKVLTRRMLLAQVNRMYDPLGLISPFVMRTKIMMRKLWVSEPKVGCDDPLPDSLKEDWTKYFKEVPMLREIAFPRAVKI